MAINDHVQLRGMGNVQIEDIAFIQVYRLNSRLPIFDDLGHEKRHCKDDKWETERLQYYGDYIGPRYEFSN